MMLGSRTIVAITALALAAEGAPAPKGGMGMGMGMGRGKGKDNGGYKGKGGKQPARRPVPPGAAATTASPAEAEAPVQTASVIAAIAGHDGAPGVVSCSPSDVVLSDYPQWQHEEGYWLGDYSLYGSDGNPSTSASWNYPYDHYKGFITGNVQGNRYRQRNVFMYPPANAASTPGCTGADTDVVGDGTCGTNGNTKVFEADQEATTCSLNPELGGDVQGPYGTMSYTYTQLVGKDNALLYQVFLTKGALNLYEGMVMGNPYGRCTGSGFAWDCGYTEDRLMQSQLTTLTQLPDKSWRRTRTAQGFDVFGLVGAPTYASYYRERKVSKDVFYAEFDRATVEYNIRVADLCAWKSSETGGTAESGYTPGREACSAHLEKSFELAPAEADAGSDANAEADAGSSD